MNSLFLESISITDPNYSSLRDEPRLTRVKEYCLHLWKQYHTFADSNFPIEFAKNLNERFWELYLGVYLLEKGFELLPKKSSEGPDFQFIIDENRFWVEATTASEGEGSDSVPELQEQDRFEPIPEEKIILRFTNALSEKQKKFKRYLEKGLITD